MTSEEMGDVAAIQTTLNNRKECLLTAPRLDEVDLPDTQRVQLVSLVLEFTSTFALDEWELGRTSVVTHKINTEGHLPIVPYYGAELRLCSLINQRNQPFEWP